MDDSQPDSARTRYEWEPQDVSNAPRWRYARKVVPAVEKGFSLLVLMILLGVAGLFVWDMRRPSPASPFTVPTDLLAQAVAPADAVTAGYLLPSQPTARRIGEPQITSIDDLASQNEALAQAARAARPRQVFLARYSIADKVALAAVLDCAAGDRAADLWTARRPKEARPVALGSAGQAWRDDSRAGFAAGAWYVEIWTTDAPASQAADTNANANIQTPGQAAASPDPVATLLTELARVHIFSRPVEPTQSTASAGPVAARDGPLPRLAGLDLTGPGEVRRFNPDTLYEKIDGKAQLYLSYNFVELLFSTYSAPDLSFDVYVYDMGQADSAFGIFKAEESDNADEAPVGRQGYFSGASIFFWKGKYYVNVLTTVGEQTGGEHGEVSDESGGTGASGEQARSVAVKLAKAIAETMQDAGQSLWAEDVLPAENRVSGSFEFRKSDAFGLDFLKDVFSARYKHGDKELTLFVTRAPSAEAARALLSQYNAFSTQYGKVIETGTVAGQPTLLAENTGTYDAVFAKDTYFGGVTAADAPDLARTAMTQWLEQLTR